MNKRRMEEKKKGRGGKEGGRKAWRKNVRKEGWKERIKGRREGVGRKERREERRLEKGRKEKKPLNLVSTVSAARSHAASALHQRLAGGSSPLCRRMVDNPQLSHPRSRRSLFLSACPDRPVARRITKITAPSALRCNSQTVDLGWDDSWADSGLRALPTKPSTDFFP